MARGNQRDKAREANLKKQASQNGGRQDNLTPAQRAEKDKAAMLAKKAAKDAQKAAGGGGSNAVDPEKEALKQKALEKKRIEAEKKMGDKKYLPQKVK
mmetsp:Transcript_8208/g.18636  ORF Transcript_8208/g.18636 Transcript_8208/m.18636 type:complete len:98 (+) Transcript_8208:53-346(+)